MSSQASPEVSKIAEDSDHPVQIESYPDYYSAVWFSHEESLSDFLDLYWDNEDLFGTYHLIYSEELSDNIEIQLENLDEYQPVTFVRLFGEEFDLTWEDEGNYSIIGFITESLSPERLDWVYKHSTDLTLSEEDRTVISELGRSVRGMTVDSLEDLFVEGLQHIYYTEQRLLDVLEELESTSTQEELQQGFSEHREETQEHVERLEQVFEQLGQEPEAAKDPVIEGMIEAHEKFVDKDPSNAALDRFNIAAGQKSEHYEIASYGNLTSLADQLGLDEVVDLLEQNMREEQEMLDELSQLGEEFDYSELEA